MIQQARLFLHYLTISAHPGKNLQLQFDSEGANSSKRPRDEVHSELKQDQNAKKKKRKYAVLLLLCSTDMSDSKG